jgi:glycosyltransferase involved in cell wall biosynthesis
LLAGFAHHARLVEERLWRESDLVLYPADSETRYVRQWLEQEGVRSTQAETVPLFAYEPLAFEVGASLEHRRNVLFVGGFAHAPNEDAAIWFAKNVWPIVHRECPEHRLCLVGADPSDTVAALGRTDVLVTAHIPEHELVAYYHSARVAVAPLRFGAGVKGKVLEAMRYGVPCVTTSIGAQGLEDAHFLRVSDDVEETARMVIALLRDDEAWMQAAHAGLAFIEERYSVASVWRTLSKVIDAVPYADVAARLRSIEERAAMATPGHDASGTGQGEGTA